MTFKKHLRNLSETQLTRLALDSGVLLPYMTRKEKVDSISDWAKSYGLKWGDFTSRFLYLPLYIP